MSTVLSNNIQIPLHLIESILRAELGIEADTLVEKIKSAVVDEAKAIDGPKNLPPAEFDTVTSKSIPTGTDHTSTKSNLELSSHDPAPEINTPLVATTTTKNEVEDDIPIFVTPSKVNKEESNLDSEGEPKVKKEYLIVLSAKAEELPADLTGWVFQVDEGTRKDEISSKLVTAYEVYNASKKGQQDPANTIGEAIEIAPPKVFKNEGLYVKTRSSVWCISIENTPPEADND